MAFLIKTDIFKCIKKLRDGDYLLATSEIVKSNKNMDTSVYLCPNFTYADRAAGNS